MQRLLDTPRVVEELNDFRNRINQIQIDSLKRECQGLLNELTNEIKNLDMAHDELFKTAKLPTMAQDHREVITNTRRKLDSKLKDIERTKLR